MRLQNKLSFLMLLLASSSAFAQNNETFRTPAKLYAGAYTVKLDVKKDLTDYTIPVWIKPDQAESTLDAVLLKDLGYSDTDLAFDEVQLSNEILEKTKFKNMKSEWAFVPDFARACCYGVIGRDILQDFEVRFNPNPPVHIQWKRIIANESAPKPKATFLLQLKDLFSLTQTNDVPFTLHLHDQKLEFEGIRKKSGPSLFTFEFVPPDRYLRVQNIAVKDNASAKKAGFKSGLVITEINGSPVDQLDRWLVEKYLRGEKTPVLKFTTKEKKKFSFDFSTRRFN